MPTSGVLSDCFCCALAAPALSLSVAQPPARIAQATNMKIFCFKLLQTITCHWLSRQWESVRGCCSQTVLQFLRKRIGCANVPLHCFIQRQGLAAGAVSGRRNNGSPQK